MTLELVFPVSGTTLATDHGTALCRTFGSCAAFPRRRLSVSVCPNHRRCHARWTAAYSGALMLRVRLPDDLVRLALPLAGKRLALGDTAVRLGVPSSHTDCRTIADCSDGHLQERQNAGSVPDDSAGEARRTGCYGSAPTAHSPRRGPRGSTEASRGTSGGRGNPGLFADRGNLSPVDSLTLLESGLGGNTRLGCGFFTPVKTEP